jgi:hypothetical protein
MMPGSFLFLQKDTGSQPDENTSELSAPNYIFYLITFSRMWSTTGSDPLISRMPGEGEEEHALKQKKRSVWRIKKKMRRK